jgi:hypothetical protein
MKHEFAVGELNEGMPWSLETDFIIPVGPGELAEPCRHCVPLEPGDPRVSGEPAGRYVACPAVVRARNEAGHNVTDVCLACILEGAAKFNAPTWTDKPDRPGYYWALWKATGRVEVVRYDVREWISSGVVWSIATEFDSEPDEIRAWLWIGEAPPVPPPA